MYFGTMLPTTEITPQQPIAVRRRELVRRGPG